MERFEFFFQVVGVGATIAFFIGVAIILWDIWNEAKKGRQ